MKIKKHPLELKDAFLNLCSWTSIDGYKNSELIDSTIQPPTQIIYRF
jgi:hypothetical protein